MCSLQEHIERAARIREAERLEPIYAGMVYEYGIEYQPLPADNRETTVRPDKTH